MVRARLVRPDDRLILLFTPPFDKTPHDPGYIKGYLPGIRENGGQYTHAALWTVWALAELGEGEPGRRAVPTCSTRSTTPTPRSRPQRYRVEPYVVAADVYSVPPHTGRGGWTWYTGSAGWMYRLGLESILGIHRAGDALRIAPHIPADWPGYDVTYRWGAATYRIHVHNRGNGGPVRIMVNGEPVEGDRVPLRDDGREHAVEVEV